MSQHGVEVVKRAYAALAEGDVPAVLGVFADGIEWHEAEGMPYGAYTVAARPWRKTSSARSPRTSKALQ